MKRFNLFVLIAFVFGWLIGTQMNIARAELNLEQQPGLAVYCNGVQIACEPYVTPSPIVPLDTATATRTASPTPTRTNSPTPSRTPTPSATASRTPTPVLTATPAETPTLTPVTNCTDGALPCWTEAYRAFEVISPVWLCIYQAAPCGSDTERQLRLLVVGEKRYIWCLYEIAPGNLWASEFKCDAAFDRSWNAVQYAGKVYMREINP